MIFSQNLTFKEGGGENKRIRLSKAITEKLEKEILTSKRLNNLGLYKIAIALLLINKGYSTEQTGVVLQASISNALIKRSLLRKPRTIYAHLFCHFG